MSGEETGDGVSEVLADPGWMIQPSISPEAGQPRGFVDGEGIQTPPVVLGCFLEGVEAFAQGTDLPSHDTAQNGFLLAFTVEKPIQIGGRGLRLLPRRYSAIAQVITSESRVLGSKSRMRQAIAASRPERIRGSVKDLGPRGGGQPRGMLAARHGWQHGHNDRWSTEQGSVDGLPQGVLYPKKEESEGARVNIAGPYRRGDVVVPSRAYQGGRCPGMRPDAAVTMPAIFDKAWENVTLSRRVRAWNGYVPALRRT